MTGKISPMLQSIEIAEKNCRSKIHIHLSKKWYEKNPQQSAHQLFRQFDLHQTPGNGNVLLYLNLRSRKIAIVTDEVSADKINQNYWSQLIRHLRDDLHSTYFENAIAMAIRTLGFTLAKYFPKTCPQ